jgi:hypothetical protein
MILSHVIGALMLVAVVGVFARGWHRRCWTWIAYAVAIIVCGGLMSIWPASFYAKPYAFWWFSRDLYAVLRILVAVEISGHVFSSFPRAERLARVLVLLLLVSSVMPIALSVSQASHTAPYLRLNTATICLFGITSLLAVWFNLPLHRWHRAVLLGLTVQLMIFTAVLGLLDAYGWELRHVLSSLSGVGSAVLAATWAVVAWTPERVRVRSSATAEGGA